SGIPDYQSTAIFQQRLTTDPFFVWNHQDLVGLIAGQPLLFTPATQWSYSNSNYLLLGLIAEAVTGRPLDELVRIRVIEPLGLTGTSFPATPDIPRARNAWHGCGARPDHLGADRRASVRLQPV